MGVGWFGIRLDCDDVLLLGLLDYENEDIDGMRKGTLRWRRWLVKYARKALSRSSSSIAIEVVDGDRAI